MMMLLGLMLGASAAAYTGLRPAAVGLPFPNLNGELTVRPTFGRIAGYLFGRWLGSCLLGALAGWLGSTITPQLLPRLTFALAALLAVFMFLYQASRHSPDLSLASVTDPAKLNQFSPLLMGVLSAGTLITPVLIGLLFSLLQCSSLAGVMLFTNLFLGTALFLLPILLNMVWVKSGWYQWLLRGIHFFTAITVLIWSVTRLLQT